MDHLWAMSVRTPVLGCRRLPCRATKVFRSRSVAAMAQSSASLALQSCPTLVRTMTAFAAAIKAEITRIARREVRAETDRLRRALVGARRDIAALKRELRDVRRGKKESARVKPVVAPTDDAAGQPLRFSAKGLKSHRARLGLTAAQFGQLVGVSGQSVYLWESGKSVPSKNQLPRIAAVRALGKREAMARLESAA